MNKLLIILILSANIFSLFGIVKDIDLNLEYVTSIESQAIVLHQDSDGFFWIGSYVDGLYRYDGKTLKHFLKSSEFASSNNISSILEDSDGVLWFVSNGSGLTRYEKDTNTVQHILYDPENHEGLSSASVYWEGKNTFIEDKKGNLWLGTIGGGLNKFDKKANRFTHYRYDEYDSNSLSSDNIRAVYEDNQGRIWIGTENGLNVLDPETEEIKRFLHNEKDDSSICDDIIMAIYQDSDGELWFGSESNGVSVLNPDGKTFRKYHFNPDSDESLQMNYVVQITEDKEGRIWIVHQTKLTIFDKKKNLFLHYKGKFDDVTHVWLCNKKKIVWIATDSGKLCKYYPSGKRFKLYKPEPGNPNSLASEIVISIYEDSRNELWISTLGATTRYNPAENRFTNYFHKDGDDTTIPSVTNYTPGFFEDTEGNFWIGSAVPAALSLFNRDSGKVVKSYIHDKDDPESIPDAQQVNSIIEDPENKDILWIGTFQGLVKFNKKTEKFRSFGTSTHWNIWDDSSGSIWATTWGEGLARFDKQTENFTYFKNNPEDEESICDNLQACLFIDSKEQLWAGTENGLSLFNFKTHKFKNYSRKNDFPIDAIHSIGEDNKGFLWLGTNSGLIRFNPETLDYRVFTSADGVQGDVFYANNGIMSKSGELWFGGTKGMNSFFPDDIELNDHIPEIKLTSIKQGGVNTNFGKAPERLESFNLGWKENFFEFEFIAFDYMNPERNQYAYMLEGLDSDWYYSGTRNYGRYAGIPPGDYTLRLKGSNNDGVWNEEGTAIKVRVLSPPWLQWWAYLIYISLIVSFVLFYHRNQREKLIREKRTSERLKELDKLKDDFLANTSHELRTPLNGIIGLAESLMDGVAGDMSQEAQKNLRMIVLSGRRLASLVNDILDFSKLKYKELNLNLQPVNLHSIVDVIITVIQSSSNNENVEIVNRIEPDFRAVLADENRIQQIFYNLIGNSVKFTDKGLIVIDAVLENEFARISVSDTGIGIPEEKLESIFMSFEQVDSSTERAYGGTGLGLAITRQLIELHNGYVSASSRYGEGTTMTFTLPVAEANAEVPELSDQKINIADENLIQQEIDFFENAELSEFKPNILIVDDEPVNLQVLTNHLSMQNYNVVKVDNGEDALKAIENSFEVEKPFDIVLLDVMMPKMSGYEVCRRLRKKFPAHKLPVMMLTAKNRVEDLVNGLEVGANDYLSKPVTKSELLARIKSQYTIKSLSDEHEQMNVVLQKANESVKTAKNYLSSIINSMPSAIFSLNYSGEISMMNKKAEELISHSVKEAEGKTISEMLPDIFEDLSLIEKSIKSKEIMKLTNHESERNGEKVFEDIIVYPVNFNEYDGVVVRIDDITEKYYMEQQLIQAGKMDSIGQLTGGIAHDFNNMLSGIMGSAELLKFASDFDEVQTKYIDLIIKTSSRAADLTSKLLTFGRKGEVTFKTTDLHEVVADSIDILQRSIDKKIRINTDLAAESSTVIGDSAQLQNVVMNLGINASHAMENGGDLTISSQIRILNETYCNSSQFDISPGRYIELEVKDTGCGISEEKIHKIFEPFYTTKDIGKGAGLGLSTVYGTVKSHHGAVNVYSEVGKGTAFHIMLPLTDFVIQDESEKGEIVMGTGTVLLADDEKVIRTISREMIKNMGYRVLIAENGVKALKMFEENSSEIDLVILDMVMPELNGLEALMKMKEIDNNVKVIISSGFTREEDLTEIRGEIAGFIKKPFSEVELSKMIYDSINKNH